MMTPRQTRVIALVGLLGLATTSWGQGIGGTPHDFSAETYPVSTEICNICHTPHNADANPPAPLWHGGTITATFTPYTSSTLDAAVQQPDGTSKACLTCHDGSVAYDRFGGNGGGPMTDTSFLLTTDLSDDHPVSFEYNANLAVTDGGLVTPTSASQVDAAGLLRLFEGKLQCSTCHDPHDNQHGNFLTMNNAGSAMCLACHNK